MVPPAAAPSSDPRPEPPSWGGLLWVSWEDHRRSRTLARILGAELCELSETLGRPRLVRYAANVCITVARLRRCRPATVICQHPSFVLALLGVLMRPVFGYRLGLDAHNGGLAIEDTSPLVLQVLAGWLQRRADFVIVHNDAVEAFVAERGGTLVALPDPLPTITPPPPATFAAPFNLLFICSFKPDEPYIALFEAAREIDPGITIHVTGDPRGKVDPHAWPDNLVFCGRVPWEQYDRLLCSVNGVIDLSTRERCLLCGAYEAVAAGKPMILSRTATLMDYFSHGAVFTDNQVDGSPYSIRRAIREVRAREAELKEEVALLKQELAASWKARLGRLQALL